MIINQPDFLDGQDSFLRAACPPQASKLQNDFGDHQWYRPIRPTAYVVQSVDADSPSHERHVRDYPVTNNPGKCENIGTNHPILMHLHVSYADRIVDRMRRSTPDHGWR